MDYLFDGLDRLHSCGDGRGGDGVRDGGRHNRFLGGFFKIVFEVHGNGGESVEVALEDVALLGGKCRVCDSQCNRSLTKEF